MKYILVLWEFNKNNMENFTDRRGSPLSGCIP